MCRDTNKGPTRFGARPLMCLVPSAMPSANVHADSSMRLLSASLVICKEENGDFIFVIVLYWILLEKVSY